LTFPFILLLLFLFILFHCPCVHNPTAPLPPVLPLRATAYGAPLPPGAYGAPVPPGAYAAPVLNFIGIQQRVNGCYSFFVFFFFFFFFFFFLFFWFTIWTIFSFVTILNKNLALIINIV